MSPSQGLLFRLSQRKRPLGNDLVWTPNPDRPTPNDKGPGSGPEGQSLSQLGTKDKVTDKQRTKSKAHEELYGQQKTGVCLPTDGPQHLWIL